METAHWPPKHRASDDRRRLAETMETLKPHDPQLVEEDLYLPDPRLEPDKFGFDMAQDIQDTDPGVQNQLSVPNIVATDSVETRTDIGRYEKMISVCTLFFGEVLQPLPL